MLGGDGKRNQGGKGFREGEPDFIGFVAKGVSGKGFLEFGDSNNRTRAGTFGLFLFFSEKIVKSWLNRSLTSLFTL